MTDTEAEIIWNVCEDELIIDFRGQTDTKIIHQNLYSCTIMAYIKEPKIKAKDTCKDQSESKRSKNFFAKRWNIYSTAKER